MVEVNRTLVQRVADRVTRAAAGQSVLELRERIDELEAEVQECRQVNVRVAQLSDLLEQLLLPVAQQDQARIAEALETYTREL